MGYALKIYEAFREYGEEKARVLAEAFEELEKRYPQILDMATKRDLSETELKLIKEIEQVRLEVEEVRKEIKEVELRLTKEVEQVRLEVEEVRKEIKEVELKLTKEIEEIRKEIKEVELKLTKEIEQVRFSTIKWIAGLIGGQTVILITTFFTLLKLFLH
jgi:predicted  nucleic acid-binding Zn-ribbon protein